MFKAEDGNTVDRKFDGAAGNDDVDDCFQCFNVGCLIADSGSVDGEFNHDKGT